MNADSSSLLLEGRDLTLGYSQIHVLHDVNIKVETGKIVCLVGPNGAGKSTLLATLAGILQPNSGTVLLHGVSLEKHSRRERAKIVGYLPQNVQTSVPYSAGEIVALGRFPHVRGMGFETDEDRIAIDEAMTLTDASHLSDRPFAEISGGERQRVLIASVLAAQPQILLLDEPTAALDIGQRNAVFTTLRKLADGGRAVVVVTHDLNLSAMFCDSIFLLADKSVIASGPAIEVVTEANLHRAYGSGFELVRRPGSKIPGVLPTGPGERT